eukprot:1161956-Pelagomonas_calceolata.AAC.16
MCADVYRVMHYSSIPGLPLKEPSTGLDFNGGSAEVKDWEAQGRDITSEVTCSEKYKSLALHAEVKLAEALERCTRLCPDAYNSEGEGKPNKLKTAVCSQVQKAAFLAFVQVGIHLTLLQGEAAILSQAELRPLQCEANMKICLTFIRVAKEEPLLGSRLSAPIALPGSKALVKQTLGCHFNASYLDPALADPLSSPCSSLANLLSCADLLAQP